MLVSCWLTCTFAFIDRACYMSRSSCRPEVIVCLNPLCHRFEAGSLALWRCASSSADQLPKNVMLEPRAPRGIAGAVALTGQPHTSNMPHADPHFWPEVDAPGGKPVHNALAVPLRRVKHQRSFVIGVMQAINKLPGSGEAAVAAGGKGFSATDEAWLTMVAEECIAALELQEEENKELERTQGFADVQMRAEAAERRLLTAERKVCACVILSCRL